MYEGNPGQFLLWYYRRFAEYRAVPPNDVHRWLADQCNSGAARLITQNIDGLDGRAGNRDYVCIHGRLDCMTRYDDQDALHQAVAGHPNLLDSDTIIPAPWDDVPAMLARSGPPPRTPRPPVTKIYRRRCCSCAALRPMPARAATSLKPYVLLFDEYYTDLYRMSTAEQWMQGAGRMVFIGTSFSVNITAIALRTAIQRGIDEDCRSGPDRPWHPRRHGRHHLPPHDGERMDGLDFRS